MSSRSNKCDLKKNKVVKLEGKRAKQREHAEHTEHVLTLFKMHTQGGGIWKSQDMKVVRECIQVIRSNPDLFSPMMGVSDRTH